MSYGTNFNPVIIYLKFTLNYIKIYMKLLVNKHSGWVGRTGPTPPVTARP
jgi:hypothetical protein